MKQKLRATFFAFLLLNLPALGQDRSRGDRRSGNWVPAADLGALKTSDFRFSVFRRHRAGPTGALRAGTARSLAPGPPRHRSARVGRTRGGGMAAPMARPRLPRGRRDSTSRKPAPVFAKASTYRLGAVPQERVQSTEHTSSPRLALHCFLCALSYRRNGAGPRTFATAWRYAAIERPLTRSGSRWPTLAHKRAPCH